MITIDDVTKIIQEKLNNALPADEQITRPFKLYTDLGDAEKAYRADNSNTVMSARYGIVTVISSNSAPLNSGALQIYGFSIAIDILVNVDRMEHDGLIAEYPEVKQVREIIDTLAATSSGIPENITLDSTDSTRYAFIPVYTLGGAGTYSIQASELGKVVPITFTVDASIVQSGVNSANITITIDRELIPCSQYGFDLVSSTEGQTRSSGGNSKFNIQETTFTISFITPLIDSAFCRKMIPILHGGDNLTPLNVSISYGDMFNDPFTHTMYAASVRLTGAIPDNVGLNIELIETDINSIETED